MLFGTSAAGLGCRAVAGLALVAICGGAGWRLRPLRRSRSHWSRAATQITARAVILGRIALDSPGAWLAPDALACGLVKAA